MSGYRRNAELSRAAMLTVAGGALVAISQRAPDISYGPVGQAILVVGGAVVAFGLFYAVRTLLRRRGDADQ